MADSETVLQTKILKNSKILVNVEEFLQDILVVSYVYESKLFEGVLLDSTKRNLPCGILPPLGLFNQQQQSSSKPDAEEDRLFSVSQRFTYFQEKPPTINTPAPPFHLRRAIRPPARYKNSRMTVRLRPRQVLCSKCRSICNENSENVDLSKKRKGSNAEQITTSGNADNKRLCSPNELSRSPRPLFSENHRDNQTKIASPPSDSSKLCPSLIPKLSRLQPNEISNALSGNVNKLKFVGNYWVRHAVESQGEKHNKDKSVESRGDSKRVYCLQVEPKLLVDHNDPSVDHCFESKHSAVNMHHSVKIEAPDKSDSDVELHNSTSTWLADSTSGGQDLEDSNDKMVLRKKRSVGSMEDLWDESVFEVEDGMRKARTDAEKKARNARTTPVIKISFGAQGEGTVLKIPSKVQNYIPSESETDDRIDQKQKTKDASAKAAKKALKKAKREARRKMLSGSGASPACSLGGGSPRYALGGASPSYEALYHRRHKHKVKHKKKHKDERKHSKDEAGTTTMIVKALETVSDPNGNKCWNILAPKDSYSAIKERCLKQKLSISLKRLNATAYMPCDYLGSNGSKSPATSSCSYSDVSDDHGEAVPDFPPPSHPLMMRISRQSVGSCLMNDGRQMGVGDVVWGKIHGFPWWPGKVLSITVSRKDDSASVAPQAHVAWYGSSTSSLMSCDQLCPFLETFKTRYNKKKRGPYKEAIRQATCEARREKDPESSILPITSSPREVNVLS